MVSSSLKGIIIFTCMQVALCISDRCFAAAPPLRLSGKQLEKQLGQYRTIRSLEANFQQIKEMKALDIRLEASGQLRLKKDAGGTEAEWEVNKPSFLKLKIKEQSLEIFDEEGKPGRPLVENQAVQAKILRPLFAWIAMDSVLISEQYEIFSVSPSKFRLLPKDAGSPVKSVNFELDSKRLVNQITLEEKSGDELRIKFTGSKVVFSP